MLFQNIKDFIIKKLKIVLVVTIAVVVAIIIIVNRVNSKVRYNDSYVNGNTAGNLYNGGYFCEKDGIIYFANPDDGMSLYSITRAGTDLKKITSDYVTYINVDDNYIYYARNNKLNGSAFSFLVVDRCALCRVKKNGKQKVTLVHDPSMQVALIGNYLYYIKYTDKYASTFNRIKIDGKDDGMVMREPVTALVTDERYLYYVGYERDHALYRIDTSDNSVIQVSSENFYNPIIDGRCVYYMDPDNDFHVTCYNLNSGEKLDISKERADCFNMYGNFIFYQRSSAESPALLRIRLDGSELTKISDGVFCNINVTSQYVYFASYENPETFFMTPTTGKVYVQLFNPGKTK